MPESKEAPVKRRRTKVPLTTLIDYLMACGGTDTFDLEFRYKADAFVAEFNTRTPRDLLDQIDISSKGHIVTISLRKQDASRGRI